MTMTEIYDNPEKWIREMENELDWLSGYDQDLEEAWKELE